MSGTGMAPVRYEVVMLKGGLDQITPTLSLDAGFAKDSVNFECAVTGGYTRVAGYERFDGQMSPSNATYALLGFTTFTNTPAVGSTITGGTSGATAVVIAVGSDYVAYTKSVGVFQSGESISVGATPIGTISTLGGTVTALNDAIYQAAAADVYRADINVVPGSGAVLGVKVFNDKLYAFRANAGGTAVEMYVESPSGWSLVPFGYEIAFSNANVSVESGDTLTQGSVTATIQRVVVESGTLVSGTNTGRLIISAPTGGNFTSGAATSTGGGSLTLGGAQTAITFATGGKFEFVTANFSGGLNTYRLYGCDGVNRAFEFDGTVFVPIATGTTPDQPKHIAAFKNYLIVSIRSSLFYSALGDPYNWTTIAGAGEIATGDTVTNLLLMTGSQSSATMAVFGRSQTSMLYGSSAADWKLTPYNTGTGGIDYTAQNMSSSYVFDQRGVLTMQASLNYGNFDSATLTNNIKTFIAEKRTHVAYSCLSREKSQYRVFFDDGWGLYITAPNGQWMGSMPVCFPHVVYCATEDLLSSGEERIYFGSTDGYVYQMEKGSSFDGQAISASVTLNFNAIGSPRLRKRFRKASLEVSGTGYSSIRFGYQLGYNTDQIAQPSYVDYTNSFSSSFWDSFTWDNFTWDGRTLMPTECEMNGTAENAAVVISSGTNYIAPYTVNSIIVHYSVRRGMR